jgi:hypothetical protein
VTDQNEFSRQPEWLAQETGFETENDWLLEGYGIASVPAAIPRRNSVRQKETVEAVMRLDYPAYFDAILGFWLVLGEIARPAFPAAEGMGLRRTGNSLSARAFSS